MMSMHVLAWEEGTSDPNLPIYPPGKSGFRYIGVRLRAVAYQALKQLDKALKDSMEAVRIDPKNKTAIDLVMAHQDIMRVLALFACLLTITSSIKCNKCIEVSSGGDGLDPIISTYSLEECDSTNANATETCVTAYDECFSSEATVTYDSETYTVTSRGCYDSSEAVGASGWACGTLKTSLAVSSAEVTECVNKYCDTDNCDSYSSSNCYHYGNWYHYGNEYHLTGTKAGCETVLKKGGLKDILKQLHSTNLDHQVHVLNCMMCLIRDSPQRTDMILKTVPLESSLTILKQKNTPSTLIGGVLYEMLSAVLEDRNYDYSKRELGQSLKKFNVPKLLPKLFAYFKECCKVAEGESLNNLINAIVKIDGKDTLNFVKQITQQITPRFLSGEEEHQMFGLRALNVILQGSFEAGGDIVKDTTELYRVLSKLLCSNDTDVQRTAAESVALIAS
eukprot:sb/3464649/